MTKTKLSRADLEGLCEVFKAKALEEHDKFRHWQARAVEAESRLAIYEPGDGPTQAAGWMNRAIVAESQLAVLRAAYEPPRPKRPAITDAAGNPEPELPTTHPESE